MLRSHAAALGNTGYWRYLMGIGIWQLVIILLIVLLLFGAKRLRNIGGDLGSAIKGFRSAVKDGENGENGEAKSQDPNRIVNDNVIECEVTNKEKDKDKV